MKQVSIADWLNELETTELPQAVGPGSPERPCALTLVLSMTDEWECVGPTWHAMRILGLTSCDLQDPLYSAFREVYRWNDGYTSLDQLSFKQIAVKFRETYPHLIEAS